MGNHQSTSWNGYPLLDTGDSTIPPWFPNFFRARPPLEYIEPSDGVVPKNYHIKGYQPLMDENTDILNKFEEADQPITGESKAQTLARLRK